MKSKIKTTLFSSAVILALLTPTVTNTALADSSGADDNTQGLVTKPKKNKGTTSNSSSSNNKDSQSTKDSSSNSSSSDSSSESDKDKDNDSANTSANTSSGTTSSSSSTTNSNKDTATKTKLPKTGYNQNGIVGFMSSLVVAMLACFGYSKYAKAKEHN